MLTAKQSQTYEFIHNYILNHGYAPTEAEIAKGIGIQSRGVVHRYVTALVKEGLIQTTAGFRRNIQLSGNHSSCMVGLPIVGTIAAGKPIEAIEDQQMFNVTEKLLKPNHFLLKVKGDSMIGDNICDGDYVICEKAQTAKNGDIIIALIDHQEATLKRFKHESHGKVVLIPSNPDLKPMHYTAERITIQGIYIGLLRLN